MTIGPTTRLNTGMCSVLLRRLDELLDADRLRLHVPKPTRAPGPASATGPGARGLRALPATGEVAGVSPAPARVDQVEISPEGKALSSDARQVLLEMTPPSPPSDLRGQGA